MDVHVREAGDKEFAGGVDYAGPGGDFEGGVGADRRNFFVINQDCGIWFWWSAGGVDYSGVGDGDGGGVGFVAGGGEEKKKEGE